MEACSSTSSPLMPHLDCRPLKAYKRIFWCSHRMRWLLQVRYTSYPLTNRFQTQPHTKLWCNEANIKSQKIGVNLNKRPRMRALASALSLAIRCSQCKISNQSHPEPPTRICMLSSRPWRQRSIRQVRRKSRNCDCKRNHQWTFLYCLRSKTCKLWLRLEAYLSKVRQDAVKRRRFCLHR